MDPEGNYREGHKHESSCLAKAIEEDHGHVLANGIIQDALVSVPMQNASATLIPHPSTAARADDMMIAHGTTVDASEASLLMCTGASNPAIVQSGARKLNMKAQPSGQPYTAHTGPTYELLGVLCPRKHPTICEPAKHIAWGVPELLRSRSRGCDDDFQAQGDVQDHRDILKSSND